MDTELIKNWKAALASDISALSAQIEALAEKVQRKKDQLQLLEKLLNSENLSGNTIPRIEQREVSNPASSQNQNPTPDEVKDRVFDILREAGRPMNIKEIHAEFLRRGLPIAGKGTPFNILVHMSREIKGTGSRFYRTGRGTYALRGRAERAGAKPKLPEK